MDAFFVLFYVFFIYSQISAFLVFHLWSLPVFVLSETITLFLFMFRAKVVIFSDDMKDYAIAFSATLAPLLFRPFVGIHIIWGDSLVVIGLIMQILSLLSLNTSFGIAPENRGVKKSGLYKVVRHPVYASYLILYIGYFMNNLSMENLLIFIVAIILQIWRLENEERLLSKSSEYEQFKKETKWKLIPGVF